MIHFIALNPPGKRHVRTKGRVKIRRHKNGCGCVVCGHKRAKRVARHANPRRARKKNWPKGYKMSPAQKRKARKNLGKYGTNRSLMLKNLAKARRAKKRYAKAGKPTKRSTKMAKKRRKNPKAKRTAKQRAASKRNIKKALAARRGKKSKASKKHRRRRGRVSRALKRAGVSKAARKGLRKAILRKPKIHGSKTSTGLTPVQIKALRLQALRHQQEQLGKAFSSWAANPRKRKKNSMKRKRKKNGGKRIARRRLPKSVRRHLRRGQKGIRVKNRRRRNGARRRRARRLFNPGISVGAAKNKTFLFFKMGTWKDTILPGVAGFSAALTLPIAVAKGLKQPRLNQGPVGVLASAVSTAAVSVVAAKLLKSEKAGTAAFTGGAIATGIKLLAWLAPKIAAKLVPMSGAPVSAPVAAPASAPAQAGFDGGVLANEELLAGEQMNGFLEMNGMGDFVDPSVLSAVSNSVGFDAGKERF